MDIVNTMSSDTPQTDRTIGKVKWFNNKAGYGFITVSDGDLAGKDIFVHYSNISVSNSQYKYLVQGEYVEFLLAKPDNGPHEFQATAVTGIKGGSIMCETRRVSREVSDELNVTRETPSVRRPAPRKRPVKNASTEPAVDGEAGFTVVSKKRPAPK